MGGTATQGESMLVPGAEELLRWTPLGSPRTLARLTVRALRRGRAHLVYPRALRLASTRLAIVDFPPDIGNSLRNAPSVQSHSD